MNFGMRLRDLRRKKNISQKLLSNRTDIPQTTISDWESGKSYPKVDKLYIIAEALGVSIQELIERSCD